MNEITNRIAAYKRRTADEYVNDPLEFQRRFMAGLAVQRRISQGKRKLKLVTISRSETPASNNKTHKQG